MKAAPPQLFTAAQVATALGRKRQAVQRLLDGISASGETVVRGNAAQLWSVERLPQALRDELAAKARQHGRRSVAHLLSDPAIGWQPEIAWHELAPECQDKAIKLRRVLLPLLERTGSAVASVTELTQAALANYRREFGHTIDERHMRRLIERTHDRDGSANNWERVEIFLPDRLARCTRVPASAATQIDCGTLRALLLSFKDAQSPTTDEEQLFWISVCEFHEKQIAAGRTARASKRALCDFIFAEVKWAADTENALRVAFDRKFARWQQSQGDAKSLADLRRENSGRFRAPALTQKDRDTIISHATFCCGGRVSQAWRELCQQGEQSELSEPLLSYYRNDPSSKSYVPHFIRDAVAAEIASLADIHHGPREAKLNGPYIRRDWSKVHAGDWMQADDFTMPVYYLESDGAGWFKLMRGQIIVMIDLRTTRILGFLLHSEQTYNARIIRSLITRVCDEHGLPRKGFAFERGLWKRARILTGDAGCKADECDWNQSELGLREFGLKFIHADLPRGKLIERTGGILQNMMEGLPGYVGRNEQVEKFERVQKQKLAIERKDENALKHFLTADRWTEEFEQIVKRYNAERQDGRLLAGLSPDDAAALYDDHANPPPKFDAHTRYLLAHHKRPMRVTGRGLSLFGHRYYGREIGHLIGREVLAWFNPDTPEILCVTDLDRKSPIAVPRANEVDAIEGGEALKQELQRAAGHLEHTKTRYRVLASIHRERQRINLTDRDTIELGQELARQTEQVRTEQNRTARTRSTARKMGMQLPAEIAARPGTEDDLRELQKLMAEGSEDKVEVPAAVVTAPKIYTLKTPPAGATSVKQQRAIYWKLRRKIESLPSCPNIFALTHRALGYTKKATEFSTAELTKLTEVFAAVLRDAGKGDVS